MDHSLTDRIHISLLIVWEYSQAIPGSKSVRGRRRPRIGLFYQLAGPALSWGGFCHLESDETDIVCLTDDLSSVLTFLPRWNTNECEINLRGIREEEEREREGKRSSPTFFCLIQSKKKERNGGNYMTLNEPPSFKTSPQQGTSGVLHIYFSHMIL